MNKRIKFLAVELLKALEDEGHDTKTGVPGQKSIDIYVHEYDDNESLSLDKFTGEEKIELRDELPKGTFFKTEDEENERTRNHEGIA